MSRSEAGLTSTPEQIERNDAMLAANARGEIRADVENFEGELGSSYRSIDIAILLPLIAGAFQKLGCDNAFTITDDIMKKYEHIESAIEMARKEGKSDKEAVILAMQTLNN
jgi:hypothetical protein